MIHSTNIINAGALDIIMITILLMIILVPKWLTRKKRKKESIITSCQRWNLFSVISELSTISSIFKISPKIGHVKKIKRFFYFLFFFFLDTEGCARPIAKWFGSSCTFRFEVKAYKQTSHMYESPVEYYLRTASLSN